MKPEFNYGWYPSYEIMTLEAFIFYVSLSIIIEGVIIGLFLWLKASNKTEELPVWYIGLMVIIANAVSGFIGYFMAISQ